MILLEPAKHDLHNSLEDQAADHLINGVIRNYGNLFFVYAKQLLQSSHYKPGDNNDY